MDATAWAAIIPVALSIVGGGLAMAWRLGGLDRAVQDLAHHVEKLEQKMDARL